MKVEIKGEKIMKFAEKIDAEYHLSSCPDLTHHVFVKDGKFYLQTLNDDPIEYGSGYTALNQIAQRIATDHGVSKPALTSKLYDRIQNALWGIEDSKLYQYYENYNGSFLWENTYRIGKLHITVGINSKHKCFQEILKLLFDKYGVDKTCDLLNVDDLADLFERCTDDMGFDEEDLSTVFIQSKLKVDRIKD